MQYADALSYLRALVVSERARQAVEVLADEAERADTAAIALIARAQGAESRARLATEEAETLRALVRDILTAIEDEHAPAFIETAWTAQDRALIDRMYAALAGKE